MPSSAQGSELPASRHTQIAVAEVIVPEADAQTPGIEDAHADAATVRVETGRADVDAFEESDTTDLEVGRDEPAHLSSIRHELDVGQKLVLLVPVFAGRVRHRRLLDGEPTL